jgi:hypothetical protein
MSFRVPAEAAPDERTLIRLQAAGLEVVELPLQPRADERYIRRIGST